MRCQPLVRTRLAEVEELLQEPGHPHDPIVLTRAQVEWLVAKARRADPYRTPEERFWEKVEKTEGCWLWTANVVGDYGQFTFQNRPVVAHRFAYELLVGPIPEGLLLDHVKANGCTSKLCVKAIADEYGPAHLEPVTSKENTARGRLAEVHRTRPRPRRTHCKNGHPFTQANTCIDRRGWWSCRICRVESTRRSRARKVIDAGLHPDGPRGDPA